MSLRIFLILPSLLLLSGCSLFGGKDDPPSPGLPVVNYEYIAYECGSPPAMTPVEYETFEWTLLKNAADNAVWSLSAEDYSKFESNTATTIEAAKQMRGQRDFWKDCIDRSQEENLPSGQ